LGKIVNSYGKGGIVSTTSFWIERRGEHRSLKETIGHMRGSYFPAVEFMNNQFVRPIK
jgi:hypothetical protein